VSVGVAMADAEKASIALREVVASFMLLGRCGEMMEILIACWLEVDSILPVVSGKDVVYIFMWAGAHN